jgi:hypothetical protein
LDVKLREDETLNAADLTQKYGCEHAFNMSVDIIPVRVCRVVAW